MADSTDLEPRHRAAADAVLGGATVTDAAVLVGAHASTVSRWLGRPDVAAYLAEARAAVRARERARMAQHVPAMLEVLRSVAQDEDQPAPARVKAACAYLDRYGWGEDAGSTSHGPTGLTARITVDPDTVARALVRLRDRNEGGGPHPLETPSVSAPSAPTPYPMGLLTPGSSHETVGPDPDDGLGSAGHGPPAGGEG